MSAYRIADLPQRIAEKIAVDANGCWIWMAARDKNDYGRVWFRQQRSALAHRVVRILLVGEIPEGLEPDHLCRVHACVNPNADHSELVTHRVNVLRGESPSAIAARRTHCPKGHEYDGTAPDHGKPRRMRRCLTCHREGMRKKRS